jgi:hypothetical protein
LAGQRGKQLVEKMDVVLDIVKAESWAEKKVVVMV